MLKGNKGEWSEIYALFKLLSDRVLNAGDPNLNKIPDIYFPVIMIIREEIDGPRKFDFQDDFVVVSGQFGKLRINASRFSKNVDILLNRIKNSKTSTFSIKEVENVLNEINITQLKAKSTKKEDIRIQIYDKIIGDQTELGFSIKSQLGNPSTLLNAGKTTNFIFQLTGPKLNKTTVDKINSIETNSKIKDRIEEIHKSKAQLKFVRAESTIFHNNMILVDSALPRIMAEIVYSYFTSGQSSIIDLLAQIEESNPVSYDLSFKHKFYSYKLKRLLSDIALGMMPSKVWTGVWEASGGYLVVKEDGDIVCYHIYNKNEFEEYLLNNTRLETASSKRHGFGMVYEQDGKYFLNLNLQIRFLV